jgi:tRNA/rRNA methyltransferase
MVAIVLVRPRNPLNIGAAARAMSNFGFDDLRLVEAYRVAVDEARSGVNAESVLAQAREYASVGDAVADCHLVAGTSALGPREPQQRVFNLKTAAARLRRTNHRIALLFGSEKFGLSNEDLSHCHWLIRIPTRRAHRSMNLGQAVAVTLYELIRNQPAPVENVLLPRRASAESSDRVVQYLAEALSESGYMKPPVEESQQQKLRRLVTRMRLSEKDAVVWQGMLRQILWRMRSGS